MRFSGAASWAFRLSAEYLTYWLTVTDLFCGGGGSSAGAVAIEGVRVLSAATHCDKAIKTHSLNHP
jgi:site-specific DNA-cytosine methylase